MSVRLGISSRGQKRAQKKGAPAARPSSHKRQVGPSRAGWSLDQIPQPRNPEKAPSTGNLGDVGSVRRRSLGCLTAPVRLRLRFAQATPDTLPRRASVAAPRVARQGRAWRPGLDLNQDKERCTAPALTLPPPGRFDHSRSRRAGPRLPPFRVNPPAPGAPRRSFATGYGRYWPAPARR